MHLGVVFLLQDKTLDQKFAIGLLLLEFALETAVRFLELTIFLLCALGDVCDELKVVLEFIFALSLLSCFVSAFGLLLFNRLLSP